MEENFNAVSKRMYQFDHFIIKLIHWLKKKKKVQLQIKFLPVNFTKIWGAVPNLDEYSRDTRSKYAVPGKKIILNIYIFI